MYPSGRFAGFGEPRGSEYLSMLMSSLDNPYIPSSEGMPSAPYPVSMPSPPIQAGGGGGGGGDMMGGLGMFLGNLSNRGQNPNTQTGFEGLGGLFGGGGGGGTGGYGGDTTITYPSGAYGGSSGVYSV